MNWTTAPLLNFGTCQLHTYICWTARIISSISIQRTKLFWQCRNSSQPCLVLVTLQCTRSSDSVLKFTLWLIHVHVCLPVHAEFGLEQCSVLIKLHVHVNMPWYIWGYMLVHVVWHHSGHSSSDLIYRHTCTCTCSGRYIYTVYTMYLYSYIHSCCRVTGACTC